MALELIRRSAVHTLELIERRLPAMAAAHLSLVRQIDHRAVLSHRLMRFRPVSARQKFSSG